jgi:hypothetical protein
MLFMSTDLEADLEDVAGAAVRRFFLMMGSSS